jgi:type III restriction enzyme
MSDFSLMDAIESGIVKLPRVPVADNIPGGDMPKFRNLWEHIRKRMPKKGRGKAKTLDPLAIPVELQTALEALYGHYDKTFNLWQQSGIKVSSSSATTHQHLSSYTTTYQVSIGKMKTAPPRWKTADWPCSGISMSTATRLPVLARC